MRGCVTLNDFALETLARARRLWREGDARGAERDAGLAVELLECAGEEVGLADALELRGEARRRLRRPKEAIVDYRRAIDLARRNREREREVRLLFRIGLCYARMGWHDQSCGTLRSAVELAELRLPAGHRLRRIRRVRAVPLLRRALEA